LINPTICLKPGRKEFSLVGFLQFYLVSSIIFTIKPK
jgi:hypothetical protein